MADELERGNGACDCAADCTDCTEGCAECAGCCQGVERAAPSDGDIVRYDMPIVRVDSDRREVWGWASSSAKGLDRKIISHEANKAAFTEWISRGNVREMHMPIAAGKAIAWEADDQNQRIMLGTRVSAGAEPTWQKILDDVLRAYSVNAKVTKHHSQIIDGEMWDVVDAMVIREVSYVDAPGDPTSHFTDIIRSADDGDLTVPDTLAEDIGRAAGPVPESSQPVESVAQDDVAVTRDPIIPVKHASVDGHGRVHLEDHSVAAVSRAEGGDETQDIALALQACAIVGQILQHEVAEALDPENPNDGYDIALLLDIHARLMAFAKSEAFEGAMETMMEGLARSVVESAQAQGLLNQSDAEPGELLRVEGPSPTELLEKMQGIQDTLVTLTADLASVREAQETISRAADPVIERVAGLEEKIDELMAQEAPGARPMTRTFPVEKAFGLEGGEGTITREGALAGLDAAIDAAKSPDVVEVLKAERMRLSLAEVYAKGPQPQFRG